jgi:hypothetical protein
MFIYFIRLKGTGFVKIGKSANPMRRLEAFVTHSPFEAELVGYHHECHGASELDYHAKYHYLNVRGEWFREQGMLKKTLSHYKDADSCPPLPKKRRKSA